MPRYDLCVILRVMQRPETAAVLRRTVETLLERGAVVRGLESLGERRLPYSISKHDCRHARGGYFSVDFYAAPSVVGGLLEHLERDVDVLRPAVLRKDVELLQTCCDPLPPAKTNRVKSHYMALKMVSSDG